MSIATNDEESFIDPSSLTCHMPFLMQSDEIGLKMQNVTDEF